MKQRIENRQWVCLVLLLLAIVPIAVFPKSDPSLRLERATVFGMADTLKTQEELKQDEAFGVQVLVRGWMHWREQTHGDMSWVMTACHNAGMFFSGGSVVSQLGLNRATLARAEQLHAVGLTPWGKPQPSEGSDVYSGSLYSPEFRKFKLNYLKRQIDMGVDLIHLDVIVQLWDLNDKFDDDTVAAFRKFLLEKYPRYTAREWLQKCGIRDIRSFNYRVYLQHHKYADGTFYADNPYRPANPLAAEWGIPRRGYMHDYTIFPEEIFPAGSFMAQTVKVVSRYFADGVRNYARLKGREVLVSFNGPNSAADFQVDSGLLAAAIRNLTQDYAAGRILVAMSEVHAPRRYKEEIASVLHPLTHDPLSPDYWRKADAAEAYFRSHARIGKAVRSRVPSFLPFHPYDPSASLAGSCRKIIERSRALNAKPDAPVIFFVDYPPPWKTLKLWDASDEARFLAVACSEIYAVGGRFAFMPGFMQSDSETYHDLQSLARFIGSHPEFYHECTYMGIQPMARGKPITTVLWRRNSDKGWIMQIVNRERNPVSALRLILPRALASAHEARLFTPEHSSPQAVSISGNAITLPTVNTYAVLTIF